LGDGSERRNVAELLSYLQQPPFGVRAGLSPLFIAVFLCSHRKTTAVLESGIYVRDFGGDAFERLLKSPGTFELQIVPLREPQHNYLNYLRKDLKKRLDCKDASKDFVRNVLTLFYRWVHGLSKFTLQTERLTPEAKAMRASLLTASDPVKLLFTDLPGSLGFDDNWQDATKLRSLCQHSKATLDELGNIYPKLLQQIEADVRKVFRLPVDGDVVSRLRIHLDAQPSSIEDFILDSATLAFLRRAKLDYPSKESWLESLCSVIAGTPLPSWTDSSIKQFEVGLIQTQQNIATAAQLCFSAAQRGLRTENQELTRIRLETASGKTFEAIVRIERVPRLLEDLSKCVSTALEGKEPSLLDTNALAEIVLDNMQSLVNSMEPNEHRKPN
jgi:hypothetical protein